MKDWDGLRFPLIRTERKKSAGATNEELIIGPVPEGRLWVINWVALEDETTAFTYLRAYIGLLGENHYLFEEKLPVAARLYWNDTPIYLPELRTLVGRFNTTTSGDKLAMYATGFELRQVRP